MFDDPYVNFVMAVIVGFIGLVLFGLAAWKNETEEGRPKSFWTLLVLALVCFAASVILAYHGRFPGV